MRVTLIAVPYDLGRADVGCGRGPAACLKAGAAESLQARGHEVEVVTVQRSAPFVDELGAVFDVDARVAEAVAAATAADSLPLVLAGNCNAAVGTLAGLQRDGLDDCAVVWLDAHGDFNTPATTESGYLDGMPLAILCGRAYRGPAAEALGLTPVREDRVLHAGGRDLDRAEATALDESQIHVVSGAGLRRDGVTVALESGLDDLARSCGREERRPAVHLHVDVDVLDPEAAPGVRFPSPGGMTAGDLLETIELVLERFDLAGVSLASYTPELDDSAASTLSACLAVVGRVAGGARREATARG